VKLSRLTDTGEWTTRRYLSLLGTVLIWIIVAIDAWYLWPSQLGGHTSMVIVSGESMEPTYFDGDLVIARKMEPSIGDVIIYAPEGLGGSQIVHRIIGGNAEDGWQLQGDNNDFIDPFTPTGDEVKGVVLVHYSNFGRVTVLLLNPMVWAFVLLAAIVLLLWWSDDCDDDDDEDEATDSAGADDDSGSDSEAGVLDPGRDPDHEALPEAGEAAPEAGEAAPLPVAHMSPWKRTIRRTSAVLAAALVAAGVMTGPASASQLAINAPSALYVDSLAKCGTLSLAATASGTASGGNYTGVTITGFSSACLGKPATVTLYNASGTALASGSVSSTTASTAFTTSSYSGTAVAKVVVKINGWVFVPSWTPPASQAPATCVAVNPGGNVNTSYPCTVSLTPTSAPPWGYDNGTLQWNYTFHVTWVTPPPNSNWKWRVTFNHAVPPFPGFTPKWVGLDYNPGLALAPGYSCAQQPVMTIESTNSTVWGATFQIGNGSAPAWFTGQSLCN